MKVKTAMRAHAHTHTHTQQAATELLWKKVACLDQIRSEGQAEESV